MGLENERLLCGLGQLTKIADRLIYGKHLHNQRANDHRAWFSALGARKVQNFVK